MNRYVILAAVAAVAFVIGRQAGAAAAKAASAPANTAPAPTGLEWLGWQNGS